LNSGFLGGVKLGALGGDFAHAVTLEREAVSVVDQAIEDGVGDGRIGDDLVPLLDRHLAGDHGRTALMAVIDHFEKIAALLAGERGESPVIEDEKIDARERLEQASIASVATGEREGLEQPGKTMIEDGTIIAAGLVAERTSNPALAGAGQARDILPRNTRSKLSFTTPITLVPENASSRSDESCTEVAFILRSSRRMVAVFCSRRG